MSHNKAEQVSKDRWGNVSQNTAFMGQKLFEKITVTDAEAVEIGGFNRRNGTVFQVEGDECYIGPLDEVNVDDGIRVLGDGAIRDMYFGSNLQVGAICDTGKSCTIRVWEAG